MIHYANRRCILTERVLNSRMWVVRVTRDNSVSLSDVYDILGQTRDALRARSACFPLHAVEMAMTELSRLKSEQQVAARSPGAGTEAALQRQLSDALAREQALIADVKRNSAVTTTTHSATVAEHAAAELTRLRAAHTVALQRWTIMHEEEIARVRGEHAAALSLADATHRRETQSLIQAHHEALLRLQPGDRADVTSTPSFTALRLSGAPGPPSLDTLLVQASPRISARSAGLDVALQVAKEQNKSLQSHIDQFKATTPSISSSHTPLDRMAQHNPPPPSFWRKWLVVAGVSVGVLGVILGVRSWQMHRQARGASASPSVSSTQPNPNPILPPKPTSFARAPSSSPAIASSTSTSSMAAAISMTCSRAGLE